MKHPWLTLQLVFFFFNFIFYLLLFYFIFWSWFYENREDKTQERCDPSPQFPVRGYFFSVNNTPAAPLGSGHQGACRTQPGKRVRQGPMKEGIP